MIKAEAIKRTIVRLRNRVDFERYGPVVVGLRILLEEQDKVDAEIEERQAYCAAWRTHEET